MPLSKFKSETSKKHGYSGEEGNPLQRLTEPMGLFETFKAPAVTLHAEQFAFPDTFLVREAKRVDEYLVNQETGWDLKDVAGNKQKTGKHFVRVSLSDGDAAKTLVSKGNSLNGLKTIQCTIKRDIPIQELIPDETLLQLIRPNVMLGFNPATNSADRIILVAEDCKAV